MVFGHSNVVECPFFWHEVPAEGSFRVVQYAFLQGSEEDLVVAVSSAACDHAVDGDVPFGWVPVQQHGAGFLHDGLSCAAVSFLFKFALCSCCSFGGEGAVKDLEFFFFPFSFCNSHRCATVPMPACFASLTKCRLAIGFDSWYNP